MSSTIITKNSSTASAAPAVGDLTKGELAVNVTDKKLYTKDNSAAIVKIVGSLGNQEANAVAITGGTIAGITDLAIADGGTGASTAANARTNLGAAASGSNSDITSLSGLTTALSVAQGGTGVTTATGSGSVVLSSSPTLVAPALGTPASGVVTNLTGTASININGTVGATTASTGAFTTLTTSSTVTHNAGTANGVAYLNGSKVLTTGSRLAFDGFSAGTLTVGSENGSRIVFPRFSDNSYVLEIASLNSVNELEMRNGSGGGQNYLKVGNGYLAFGAASSEQMRLTSTGLGIGTSSPTAKLNVVDASNSFAGAFRGSSGTNFVALGTTSAGASIAGYTAGFAAATDLTINPFGGNLGLGVTPSAWGTQWKALQVNGASLYGNSSFTVIGQNIVGQTASDNYIATGFASRYIQAGGAHQFFTAPSGTAGNAITFTQAMTLDASGNLLVGTTSLNANAGGLRLKNNNVNCGEIAFSNNSGSADYVARFLWGSTPVLVGNITVSSTATAYNTSSDYRLKNTIAPMTGALAKVALLKPCTYKWNADGSDGEGFIAHELAEVVPQCVTGEKDAVDAEGKPQYQGIDTSFLVATLTAAIQELKAEFDAYKASHP
jgi:hypothetical protein